MKEIKKELKIEDVVMKLIGNVQPVGETHTDKKRFENLEVLNDVFHRLFNELIDIIYYNKNYEEWSIQDSVKKARNIIEDTCVDYFYDLGYRLKSEQEKKDELLGLYREKISILEDSKYLNRFSRSFDIEEVNKLSKVTTKISKLEEELKDVHR